MIEKIVMPQRIAELDRDRRGLPIPWNVLRGEDGWPFFIVNDDRRAFRALREMLCPICGQRLGRWRWFVGGPRSAFDPNGFYIDLPAHRECAEFALGTCPYLALPRYMRLAEAIAHKEKLPPEIRVLLDETMVPERPEIFVAVAATKIELAERGFGLRPYLKPVKPFLDWTFWRHGRRIEEEEALPFLRAALGEGWELPGRAEG